MSWSPCAEFGNGGASSASCLRDVSFSGAFCRSLDAPAFVDARGRRGWTRTELRFRVIRRVHESGLDRLVQLHIRSAGSESGRDHGTQARGLARIPGMPTFRTISAMPIGGCANWGRPWDIINRR
jgi:hypothetical protein